MSRPDHERVVGADGDVRFHLVGAREAPLRTGRRRAAFTAAVFAACFLAIGARLVGVTLMGGGERQQAVAAEPHLVVDRADIVDRNGVALATNLATATLYADASRVLDPARSAQRLAAVLPDLSRAEVEERLRSGRRYVQLKRHLTPRQQHAVNVLGIPGLGFEEDERRVYPLGELTAHVVGYTDVDSHGIAGVEKFFDAELTAPQRSSRSLRLSIDSRVQHAVRNELQHSIETFNALGGGGLVMDVHTGEVLAMVSLPDFDPNLRTPEDGNARFNRISLGVYELGSVFKTLTMAMGLDYGVADFRSGYDATNPIRVSRFQIRDDHPEARWLTLPEIFVHSSNIGSAKLALDVGGDRQREFLKRVGLLSRPSIELPEVGAPLSPDVWREINTMTIAFGHGIAVSPLQFAAAVAAMVNGGIYRQPTLIRRDGAPDAGRRVVSLQTSLQMRRLLRQVVEQGTGRKADVPGYLIGGKTGTAEKAKGRGYARRSLLSSFVAVFPMHAPRYVVYALVDEPKGTKQTFGYATAGWTAAPAVGRIVARIAPLLGVVPVDAEGPTIREAMAVPPPDQPRANRVAAH